MESFQFADIIILALIAGFIALRLRNTLGKDVGHRPENPSNARPTSHDVDDRVVSINDAIRGNDTPIKPILTKDAQFEKLQEPIKSKISDIKSIDSSFSVDEFLKGAKGAFEWVTKAFNDGDKPTLKQLMSAEIYKEFEQVIAERAKDNTYPETTLVSIDSVEITEVETTKTHHHITVNFSTSQVHIVKNEQGEVIAGNVSHTTHVEDEWVFERSVKSRDPNWTIIDT